MKKTLIIFIAILVGLFVVLSLLDMKGNYAAEKILWHANQELARVAKAPDTIPDAAFERIADSYRKVIKQFPNLSIAPGVHLMLGQTYFIKKDYPKAREIYRSICSKYPENKNVCAQALAAVGRTYELQDKWSDALGVYRTLTKDYSLTDAGLAVPLHIAKYYQQQEKPREARDAYMNAITQYKTIEDNHPNSLIEFKVLGLLSTAYIDTQKWQEALNALSKSLELYPNPQTAPAILRSIDIIALGKLQDKGLAIKIYQKIINEKPNHPLAGHLAKVIEGLKTLDTTGVNTAKQ